MQKTNEGSGKRFLFDFSYHKLSESAAKEDGRTIYNTRACWN